MFLLDAVIMNENRHLNNLGFLVDNDMKKIVDFASLFDHNRSLLSYVTEEEFENIDQYVARKGPRLEHSFILPAKMCLTPKIRQILIGLNVFEFVRHPEFNLPEWRMKALEKQIQCNIDELLT